MPDQKIKFLLFEPGSSFKWLPGSHLNQPHEFRFGGAGQSGSRITLFLFPMMKADSPGQQIGHLHDFRFMRPDLLNTPNDAVDAVPLG
jgi:hypothetical protein